MACRSPRLASAVLQDLAVRADPVEAPEVSGGAGVAGAVLADPAEAAGVAGNLSSVFREQR